MSSNGKIKVYKNPARNSQENYKPYVPQYQLLGMEPEEYKNPLVPSYQGTVSQASPSQDNPRMTRPVIRQPYAEAVTSPIGRGKGPIPNVGNNIEQTWASVDGDIVDDLSNVDGQSAIVDNNEFVSAASLGLPEESVIKPPGKAFNFITEQDLSNPSKDRELNIILNELEEDSYLLMVHGGVVCSGPLDYIQEQVRLLIFGEHEICQENPLSTDDILVLKRIKIKVGVFLE